VLVAGVDGGGTQTRVALVDGAGETLGVGVGGGSFVHDLGVEKARENIGRAFQEAWNHAAVKARPLDFVFLGMAGVADDADRNTILRIALDLNLATRDRIEVDHDLRIALAGGLTGRPGIVLIAGTGSSCYGRRADGRSWISGGWGHLLDDVGSSYYLGLHALIAMARACDGRGRATTLRSAVMARLGISDVLQIMQRVYIQGLSRVEIAAMAPLVTQAAAAGDSVALEILAAATRELALMVETAARKLEFGPGETLVTATGGLPQSGAPFTPMLFDAIRRAVPWCEIVEPALQPLQGAALLALDHAGIASSPDLIERLKHSQT